MKRRYLRLGPFRRLWDLVVLVALAGAPALPARAELTDEALLFSAPAAQKASGILKEIRAGTAPGHGLSIRTLPSVPSNDDVKAIAQRLLREHRRIALLIVIVKEPPLVIFAAADDTLRRIEKAEEMRQKMVDAFSEKRYDEGLLEALPLFRDQFFKLFPREKATAAKRPAEGGSSWWDFSSWWNFSSGWNFGAPFKGMSMSRIFTYILIALLLALFIPRRGGFNTLEFFFDGAVSFVSRLFRSMKSSRPYKRLIASAGRKPRKRNK